MPFIGFAKKNLVMGGLLSDADVEVQDLYFTLEGPPGYGAADVLFVKGELKLLTGDQETVEQWWSCGSSNDIVPGDADGKPVNQAYRAIPAKDGTSPSFKTGSNWGYMAGSLEDQKFPVDKMEAGDLSVFKTLQMHVKRFVPKREGLEKVEGKRDPSTLICERILKLPGEKAPAKATRAKAVAATAVATAVATAATVAAAPAPAPVADVDVDALAVESFRKLIAEAKGPLDLNSARGQLFRNMQKSHPAEIRNRVIQKLADEEWLVTNGFAVEGGSLTQLG